MLTASKKWALVTGFAIVAGVLAGGAMRSHPFRGGSPSERSSAASRRPVGEDALAPVSGLAPASRPETSAGARPPNSSPPPRFDVVRVEPNGEMVLAGQAAPGASVALVGDGRVLADARADASGHFAILPPALAAGDHALSLRQTHENTLLASSQSMTVSVPAAGGAPVGIVVRESAVTMGAPPSQADPSPSKAQPSERGTAVAIDAPVATVESAAGVAGLRSHGAGQDVLSAHPVPRATTNIAVDEISTTAVRAGDNLWTISRARLGRGRRYTQIYAANATRIRDPKLIYPGQVFVLPSLGN